MFSCNDAHPARKPVQSRPGRLIAAVTLALTGIIVPEGATDDFEEGASVMMLTLEAAQRRAFADNPNLHAVEARVRQATEQVRQARAAFFPAASLEWNATHTRLPDNVVRQTRNEIRSGFMATMSRNLMIPAPPLQTASSLASAAHQSSAAYNAVPDSVDNYSVSVSVGYVLFSGFARKHAYAMARFGEQETRAAADEARRLILEAVAQTYYGAQLAHEQVAITTADTAFNMRLLNEARARNRVGEASRSEMLNFEVRYRASKARHIAAEQELRLAFIALAALMGIDDAALPENTLLTPFEPETEADMDLPDFDPLFEHAWQTRPDLEMSRQTAKRAQANIGLQQAGYYPSVTAFISKDAARTGSGNFDSEDVSTTIGVGFSYDLFIGGRRRAIVAEARQGHKEAEHRLRAAEIAVAEELREALSRLEAAQQQLRLQSETATYVEENRDMTEKEFRAGLVSLALLNQAQRDLVEAQATLALARVSLRAAWHNLRTATGETIAEAHTETIDNPLM